MARPAIFEDKEREYFLLVIGEAKGNISVAKRTLSERGYSVGYETLRTIWKNKDLNKSRDSDFSVEQIKTAVKLYEATNFDTPGTLQILSDQGCNVDSTLLKRWYKSYAKDVCDNIRFRDTVSNISMKLAIKHEDFVEDVYKAKTLVIEKIIELIPKERNLDKLTKLYVALTQAGDPFNRENQKEGITFIQQYNQYFANLNNNENTKNTDQGNIQDVTPEHE